MNIEALIFFETSVSVYHSTRGHIREVLNLHYHSCQSFGALTSKHVIEGKIGGKERDGMTRRKT